MEIAILQALISQEKRVGTAASGLDGSMITEDLWGEHTGTATYPNTPIIHPWLWHVDNRNNNPSTPAWSNTALRTYMSTQSYSNELLARILTDQGNNGHSAQVDRHGLPREITFLSEQTDGISNMQLMSNNDTSYGPFFNAIAFYKNETTTAQTFNISVDFASYWSSGYDGAGLSFWMPNHADYSSVTGVTWTSGYSSSYNQYTGSASASISVPAGVTLTVHKCATLKYWTTFSSGGHWYYHFCPTVESAFNNNAFKPDLRMMATAHQYNLLSRNASETWNNGPNLLVDVYQACGDIFGEEDV